MTALSRLDPDQLYQKLIDTGEIWTDRDAAANLLEETKKAVLAQLTVLASGKSMAEREASALSSDTYRGHLEKMVEARRLALAAKVKYDGIRTWIDMMRSVEATKRQEMGMR
jgi:hypothetical protein